MIVDATTGHKVLSFIDINSTYNQIRLNEVDQEKTFIITDRGLCYYKVMPFGLQYAGATYQRLVNKMFKHQIWRNMELYMDDLLIKRMEFSYHVKDLREAFKILR